MRNLSPVIRGLGRLSIVAPVLFTAALPGPAGAPTVKLPPPPTQTAPDPYPYVDSAKRVLRTAVSTQGTPILADRIIVSVQPGLTATDLAAIHEAAAKYGAGVARPVRTLRGGAYLVDV